MKSIKDLITENQLLSTTSNHKEIDIINAEKVMAKLLVGLTFELTFKTNNEDLGNTNLSSFEFNPMSKEINHVIAHMIESYLNPKTILSYTNKKTDKLDMTFDGNNLEIKTSYNDLTSDGKTPNNQKLYFSSQNQYDVLKNDSNALLLYIYYELSDVKATIKKVYLRAANMIEATPKNKIDKEGNLTKRKATNMCITKLLPITKGNGEKI